MELTGMSSLPDTQYQGHQKAFHSPKKKSKKRGESTKELPVKVKVCRHSVDKIKDDLVVQGTMMEIKQEEKEKKSVLICSPPPEIDGTLHQDPAASFQHNFQAIQPKEAKLHLQVGSFKLNYHNAAADTTYPPHHSKE